MIWGIFSFFMCKNRAVVIVNYSSFRFSGGDPTIRGDARTHAPYDTSSKEQFPGKYLPYVRAKPDVSIDQ